MWFSVWTSAGHHDDIYVRYRQRRWTPGGLSVSTAVSDLHSTAVFRPGPLLCSFPDCCPTSWSIIAQAFYCNVNVFAYLSVVCRHPYPCLSFATPLIPLTGKPLFAHILDCLLTGPCQLIPCWCNILWWLSVKPVNFLTIASCFQVQSENHNNLSF